MLLSSSSDQKGKDDPCPSLSSIESEGVMHFYSSLQVPHDSPSPQLKSLLKVHPLLFLALWTWDQICSISPEGQRQI